MKMKMIFAALLMVISAAVNANSGDVSVKEDSPAVFKLYYNNPNPGKVKVRILDEDKKVVFSEYIKNEGGFARPYNMKYLPEGTYTFEIISNGNVESYEFSYEMPKLEIGALIRNIGEDQYMVTVGNPSGIESNITIFIENSKGEVLYTSVEAVQSQFAQLFNLQAVRGDVIIRIFHGDEKIKEASF